MRRTSCGHGEKLNVFSRVLNPVITNNLLTSFKHHEQTTISLHFPILIFHRKMTSIVKTALTQRRTTKQKISSDAPERVERGGEPLVRQTEEKIGSTIRCGQFYFSPDLTIKEAANGLVLMLRPSDNNPDWNGNSNFLFSGLRKSIGDVSQHFQFTKWRCCLETRLNFVKWDSRPTFFFARRHFESEPSSWWFEWN